MKFYFSHLILAIIILSPVPGASSQKNQNSGLKVKYLESGDVVQFSPESRRRGFVDSDIQIYCYAGNGKTLGRIYETIELQLDIENDDFTQYSGEDPEIVQSHYEEQKSIFSINLFTQKKTRLSLSPFQQQCIGIETIQPYRLHLNLIRVDFWRVIQMAIGLIVFFFAAKLSQNSIFYYITGVMLGICSSFMLLIYLAGKLFPKRPMMYGVLIGGWTIGIYIIQILWENFRLILITYQSYVFWYIIVTGFISFIFCYRLGPPKNKRSKNLIKWGLQLVSLITIYFSSQFEEASASVIILTILMHYFPRSWLRKVRAFYMRRFPPKQRLLTNEEYYEQGVRETTKALDELRSFCSSPECKQWKTMRKLKDPIRFADFVEGASHIKDDEILHYESSKYENSDDEDSEDEKDYSCVHRNRNNSKPYQQTGGNAEDDISEDEYDHIRSAASFNSSHGGRLNIKRIH